MINHIEPYYGDAEIKAIYRYLRSGGFMTEHKVTEEFERILAKFLNVPYVSCVPNGTTALYLSLLASGIGRNDEVIVPDLTMIATPNAVKMTGAEPVLVDVDGENYCLDIEQIKITKKTKAIIYVDLNGRSGDLEEVRRYCKKHKLVLIEDACQAFGSKYEDKYLGTFGKFGCFSLGFHKIITTGQGGFIVTHTKKDYQTIERLKDFGRLKGGNDIHDYLGFNFKFTDLQAVIGIEQLKTIGWRINKKRQIYRWYHGVEAPEGSVPWFIEYYGSDRDKVYVKLMKKGIGCRKMYPPIHTQKIYKNGSFPWAQDAANNILWLPSSLSLTYKKVDYIKKQYA